MFADGLREVFLQWHRAQVADCSGASASSGKVRLRRGCPRRQGRRIPRVEADSAARAQAPPQRLAYSFLLMMLALLLEATAVRRSSTWQPRTTPFRWHRSEPRFLAQVISRAWFRNFRSIQSIQLEPLAFSEGLWASFYSTEHRFEDAGQLYNRPRREVKPSPRPRASGRRCYIGISHARHACARESVR